VKIHERIGGDGLKGKQFVMKKEMTKAEATADGDQEVSTGEKK